jgi:hypothetical protein
MIQIRIRRYMTRHDTMPNREECIGPLLEQPVHRGEYVWSWRRVVVFPDLFNIIITLLVNSYRRLML